MEKQPDTELRVLQDNADKFQHNKDLTDRRVKAVEDAGAFRAPTNAARSDVQQLGAVDSMTVRSTEGRETLLKLALAAGQRQRGGPADETGQAGGCEAAGRLPGASEAQDPRLAFFKNWFFEALFRPCFRGSLKQAPFGAKKTLITLKLELPDPDRAKKLGEKRVSRHCHI